MFSGISDTSKSCNRRKRSDVADASLERLPPVEDWYEQLVSFADGIAGAAGNLEKDGSAPMPTSTIVTLSETCTPLHTGLRKVLTLRRLCTEKPDYAWLNFEDGAWVRVSESGLVHTRHSFESLTAAAKMAIKFAPVRYDSFPDGRWRNESNWYACASVLGSDDKDDEVVCTSHTDSREWIGADGQFGSPRGRPDGVDLDLKALRLEEDQKMAQLFRRSTAADSRKWRQYPDKYNGRMEYFWPAEAYPFRMGRLTAPTLSILMQLDSMHKAPAAARTDVFSAPVPAAVAEGENTLAAAFDSFNAVCRHPDKAVALKERLASLSPAARDAEMAAFIHSRLSSGSWVRIVGLRAKPLLNYMVCSVVGEPINGRYPVHLGGERAEDERPRTGVRIRPENLRPLMTLRDGHAEYDQEDRVTRVEVDGRVDQWLGADVALAAEMSALRSELLADIADVGRP